VAGKKIPKKDLALQALVCGIDSGARAADAEEKGERKDGRATHDA